MKHALPLLAAVSLVSANALAADPHDLHDEHDVQDVSRHRPHGTGHHHHGHAHPHADVTHPIITESPLPETHLRFDYVFADGDEAKENTFVLSAEYAFTPEFSIEAVLPYSFIDGKDGEPDADRIGDAIIAAKLATYRWADDYNILPAIGLEVVLPTGNEERGIGSDHVVELEPFIRVGYWNGPFQLIGTLVAGIPLNQTDEEDAEEDWVLEYNLSALYHVTRDVQALLELSGERVFGEEEEHVLTLTPGITAQPFADKSITVGVGVSVPVSNDKEFDYAVTVMTLIHF